MFTATQVPYDHLNKVSLEMNGSAGTYITDQESVGDFLEERGIDLKAADKINLPLDESLEKTEKVIVEKAKTVTVRADGKDYEVTAYDEDVATLLENLNISLGVHDRVNANLTDPVSHRMILDIQRVVIKEETLKLPISHGEEEVESATLMAGTKNVQTAGKDGQRTIVNQKVYVDGQVESEEILSDSITQEPQAEVILVGTKKPVVKKVKAEIKKEKADVKKVATETRKDPKLKNKVNSPASKKITKPATKKITKKTTKKTINKATKTAKQTSSSVKQTSKKSNTDNQNWKSFTLTFYTDLPSENGGYTITATGEKLRSGMVASNYHAIGTEIHLSGWGTYTVKDRGGSNFNSSNRLDVFIPRKNGESNATYLNRVNKMGIKTVKGYVK